MNAGPPDSNSWACPATFFLPLMAHDGVCHLWMACSTNGEDAPVGRFPIPSPPCLTRHIGCEHPVDTAGGTTGLDYHTCTPTVQPGFEEATKGNDKLWGQTARAVIMGHLCDLIVSAMFPSSPEVSQLGSRMTYASAHRHLQGRASGEWRC